MNNVVLVGRIANDLELKSVGQGTSVITFNVAVDRRFKNQKGERETDFIRCVAWKQTADFIAKYFSKGEKIGLIGEINTRNFDGNDGKKVYITEVKVDQAHFVESKNSSQPQDSGNQGYNNDSRHFGSSSRSGDQTSMNSRKNDPDDDLGLPFSL